MNTQMTSNEQAGAASIEVLVRDGAGEKRPIAFASIGLFRAPEKAAPKGATAEQLLQIKPTDVHGRVHFEDIPLGCYVLRFLHHAESAHELAIDISRAEPRTYHLNPQIGACLEARWQSRDCKPLDCGLPQPGDSVVIRVNRDDKRQWHVQASKATRVIHSESGTEYSMYSTVPGRLLADFILHSPAIGPATGQPDASIQLSFEDHVVATPPQPVSGQLGIALTRTETEPTEDLPLWAAIRNGTDALGFNRYLRFMDVLFGGRNGRHKGGHGEDIRGFGAEKQAFDQLKQRRFLPFNDSDSYRVLKAATEAFVMVNCGVLQPEDGHDKAFRQQQDTAYLGRRDLPGFESMRGAFNGYLEPPGGILPYLALVARKLPDIPIIQGDDDADGANLAVGFVHEKLANPCLVELIWSYWHEEAMLVQTMNAVSWRFQNRGAPGASDPLANLEIDPLRPLNSLLWGYTQDEQHRLTVNRRNAEYDHQYGLRLRGKAVKDYRTADSRSQFLEGFHHLLRLLTVFYKQDDDTTVKADAFPVLNALKEVHLVMSQGAHNNFGELATTARIEMLMQQWLLGRPEFREFLPSRIMVAYPEPWMDRVDAMKKLQGWTDTSVVHFRNLAIFGEQVMLSIRFGAWSEVYEPTQAFNWARFWRPQVQGYIHAYRAATGMDLASETSDPSADATLPSLLMQRRLAQQQRNA